MMFPFKKWGLLTLYCAQCAEKLPLGKKDHIALDFFDFWTPGLFGALPKGAGLSGIGAVPKA